MDNRKKLLKLVGELMLPITPKEAEERVESLSDEEVKKLVSVYQDIKDYQDAIDDVAQEVDPKKYAKIQEEYETKMDKVENDYAADMEKLQKEEDDELDKIEGEAVKKVDEAIKKQDKEIDEIESLHDDLYSKLDSAITK